MRQALALIPTTFVLASALACGNFGGTPPEEPLLTPADATTPAAVGEASTECCCAYIQESNGEKAYDHMVASNCTSWGFECVDEGFCDGAAPEAQTDDPATAVATPTPAPAATPAPAPASARPAPAPARTMTRPGSSRAPSSGSAGGMSRPSSGGSTRPSSTRPSSTRPSSTRPSSTRPSSGGGMTRPR